MPATALLPLAAWLPVELEIPNLGVQLRDWSTGSLLTLGIGTLAFFILLYMAASKLIPLIPVWEVEEGQMAHAFKKYGRETVVTVSELE